MGNPTAEGLKMNPGEIVSEPLIANESLAVEFALRSQSSVPPSVRLVRPEMMPKALLPPGRMIPSLVSDPVISAALLLSPAMRVFAVPSVKLVSAASNKAPALTRMDALLLIEPPVPSFSVPALIAVAPV